MVPIVPSLRSVQNVQPVKSFIGSMFNVGGELPRSRIPEDEIFGSTCQMRYKVAWQPPFYWVVTTVDAVRSPGSPWMKWSA